MSRTVMGFHKFLWNYATYGLMEHSKRGKTTVDGYWSDGQNLLKKGDIVGINIWHQRGYEKQNSLEQWRVVKVETPPRERDWEKRPRRVWFERIEPE